MIQSLIKQIIIGGSIIFTSWSCSVDNTNLVFENRSNLNIDSVLFSVNSSKYKLTKISARSSQSFKVAVDTLNTHHVMVIARIYIKDSVFRGGYHYNDLSGELDDEYKLILMEDSTTKWSIE